MNVLPHKSITLKQRVFCTIPDSTCMLSYQHSTYLPVHRIRWNHNVYVIFTQTCHGVGHNGDNIE
jgi:hypothetical protein